MTDTPRFEAARRFCAVMALICWPLMAADLVYLAFQVPDLWRAWHGDPVGASIGVTVSSGPAGEPHRTSQSQMITGSLTGLGFFASTLMGLAALWYARACFQGFARGEVFGRGTLRSLQRFALAALLMQLGPALASFATVIAITGVGRTVGGGLGSMLMLAGASLLAFPGLPNVILLGLFVALVAALGRAVDLAEDNAAIV